MDDVWRMKKSVFSRADWYPAVKKGKQALCKGRNSGENQTDKKMIERQVLLQGYGCS